MKLSAMTSQYHAHASTWAAMTHGQKAWWIGRNLAATLSAMGNNATAVNSCFYLDKRPHPSVKFVVQDVGEILLVGEHVPHTACALAPIVLVGSQFGYWKNADIADGRPGCVSHLGFTIC